MHPEIAERREGRCPKCGMKLVPKDEVEPHSMNHSVEDIELGKTTWKNYIPLIVIIGLILLTTSALGLKDLQFGIFSLQKTLSYFMIGFFLTFAGFKLMDLKGFAQGYFTYDLLAQKWFTYGYIYPFIELFFGLAMIFIPQSQWLLWSEFLVMSFSGIGVANKLLKREQFHCVCLGTFLKVPLTKVTLIENFGMAILALIMLLMHSGPESANNLIFQLHSPEEFRYLSSLGHWIAGYIFLGVAAVVFIQRLGILKKQTYLWPAIVVISGLIFIPYNLLHHGIDKLSLVWQVITLDPQQRQHMIMFVLLFLAGVIEFLISLQKLKTYIWKFAWPSVLTIVGLMFFFHPQHGTVEAMRYSFLYHKTLGSVLVLTGILKGIEVSSKRKWISLAWIIFLFITSILLIIYNEPEGAYQMNSLGIPSI